MKQFITFILRKEDENLRYWIGEIINKNKSLRTIAKYIKRIDRRIKPKMRKPLKEDVEDYHRTLVSLIRSNAEQSAVIGDALELIHRVFATRGVQSRRFADEWWVDFISAASHFDEDGKAAQTRLIDSVNNSDIQYHESWEMLHVYVLCLRFGLLEVGYALRSKARKIAIEQLLEKEESNLYYFISGLAALMESSRYAEVEERLSLPTAKYSYEKELFGHLCRLFYPSNDPNQRTKSHIGVSEKDRAFGKMVKGRTVAVVGPAKTDKRDAKHIDSHDLVVRANYRERGIGCDESVKGLRCDVTYLNDLNVRRFVRQRIDNWPEGVGWVVVKSPARVNDVAAKFLNKSGESVPVGNRLNVPNIRFLHNTNPVLFNGTLNAIPNVVLDLLRFDPALIRVFHSDLMLTVERTKGYSPKTWQYEEGRRKFFLDSISAAHDPVTQYWVLHELWDRGRIEGDQRFNEVMSLGEAEYMRALQKIYGNAGR